MTSACLTPAARCAPNSSRAAFTPPSWSTNAGFGAHEAFTDEGPDRLQSMIALNVASLVDCRLPGPGSR
jgi:hypothetical protein